MIKVGIVGTLAAVSNHANALGRIKDIQITGRWVTGGEDGRVTDPDTGNICQSPIPVTANADALIIAGGGSFSNDLAVAALRSARHVYLNTMALRSVNEVIPLIKLAREANVILRAGKSGRVNIRGLVQALHDKAEINMIELQHYHRVNGHNGHIAMPEALLADLEVINSLVKARISSIKAKGICMLASRPDIVNARLEFDNGCAVNYNCNLVAAQDEFLCTLVLKNRILKYNFITGELTSWLLQPPNGHEDPLSVEHVKVDHTDALAHEMSDFFSLVRSGPAFLSINDNGFEPYVMADRIMEKIMKTLVQCS